MPEIQEDLIYLYGITQTKVSQRNFQDMGVKVYSIYSQGTYAIVSQVSSDEFSEENFKKNLANMEWIEKQARQHERIIEKIMELATVLPFKLGTIFQSEGNVKKLLRVFGPEYKKMLADLEYKEEWGLKIYCDIEQFKAILEQQDERVQEKEQEIASCSKGKAYFLRKKKDELLKGLVSERISEDTKDCFERLKKPSLKAKVNRILPKEVTEKKEEMIFNAAFLVNKKRLKECDEILTYLRTQYSPKGLEFDWTGPWPAYNFCSLEGEKG